MKHEFTSNDLGRALDQVTYDAGKIQGVSYVTLRQFLDALPEPDVPHCGDCAVDRAKAGVYEQLLDHPYFDGWSEADESVEDYMIGRLNEAHAAEQDAWEECTIDQIRRGDRFKVEGRGWHYESTAEHVDVDIICVNPRTGSFITRDEVDQMGEITVYRIPAPIVHPSPADHPVIVNVAVEKPGTNSTHRYDYATWDAEDYYLCWNKDGKYYGGWQASTITEWEPADIVPKVVETNE